LPNSTFFPTQTIFRRDINLAGISRYKLVPEQALKLKLVLLLAVFGRLSSGATHGDINSISVSIFYSEYCETIKWYETRKGGYCAAVKDRFTSATPHKIVEYCGHKNKEICLLEIGICTRPEKPGAWVNSSLVQVNMKSTERWKNPQGWKILSRTRYSKPLRSREEYARTSERQFRAGDRNIVGSNLRQALGHLNANQHANEGCQSEYYIRQLKQYNEWSHWSKQNSTQTLVGGTT